MDAEISDELLSIMLSSALDTLEQLQSPDLAPEVYGPFVPTIEQACEAFTLAVQRGWAQPELSDNAQVLFMALQAGEPIEQVRVLAKDTRARIPDEFLDPDSALGA
jgi:hypothetical protein